MISGRLGGGGVGLGEGAVTGTGLVSLAIVEGFDAVEGDRAEL